MPKYDGEAQRYSFIFNDAKYEFIRIVGALLSPYRISSFHFVLFSIFFVVCNGLNMTKPDISWDVYRTKRRRKKCENKTQYFCKCLTVRQSRVCNCIACGSVSNRFQLDVIPKPINLSNMWLHSRCIFYLFIRNSWIKNRLMSFDFHGLHLRQLSVGFGV